MIGIVVGIGLAGAPAAAVTIDWMPVGDPGNAPDASENCVAPGCGSVGYGFWISRYEITNAQYAEFLNAKAASDSLALYSTSMTSSPAGGIVRNGSPGSYTYEAKPGYASRPVTFVGFYDALRFANWLHNGQGAGDTESGAYTLLGGTATPSNGTTVSREAGAAVALPSENEWYKAAYYDAASAGYFDFPAASDAEIVCASPTAEADRANCDDAVGNVSDVGAYPGSASPAGSFDQAGNVWEWNEQIVGDESRGVRGGGWDSDAGDAGASVASFALPSTEDEAVGFRVVSLVPEPSGARLAALLGLAGVALGRAARRRSAG